MKPKLARYWIAANLGLCVTLAVTWWWMRSTRPGPAPVPTRKAPAGVQAPPATDAAPKSERMPDAPPAPAPRPEVEPPPSDEPDFLRYASQTRRKARIDSIEPLVEELKTAHLAAPVPALLPPPPTRRMGFMNFPELADDPEFGAEYRRLKAQLTEQTDQAILRSRAMGAPSVDSVQRLGSELNGLGAELMALPKESPQRAELQTKYEQAQSKLRNALFVLPLAARLSYAPTPLSAQQEKELYALAEREDPTVPVRILNRDGSTREGAMTKRPMTVSDEFLSSASRILNPEQLAGVRELKAEQEALKLRRQLPAESELPGPPGT